MQQEFITVTFNRTKIATPVCRHSLCDHVR